MPNGEETTGRVEEQEISILQALLQKGPALPVEVAVRTFSFPEEIVSPLQSLEEKGEVKREQLGKGEMFTLTQKGYARIAQVKPGL